jgi:hypothetical protein
VHSQDFVFLLLVNIQNQFIIEAHVASCVCFRKILIAKFVQVITFSIAKLLGNCGGNRWYRQKN